MSNTKNREFLHNDFIIFIIFKIQKKKNSRIRFKVVGPPGPYQLKVLVNRGILYQNLTNMQKKIG